MAERFHLFPYRTQKLSFLTPKVLAGTLAGRIGHRHFSLKELLRFSQWLFSFLSFSHPPVSHACFFFRACLTLPARMVYNWIEGNGENGLFDDGWKALGKYRTDCFINPDRRPRFLAALSEEKKKRIAQAFFCGKSASLLYRVGFGLRLYFAYGLFGFIAGRA